MPSCYDYLNDVFVDHGTEFICENKGGYSIWSSGKDLPPHPKCSGK